MADWLSFRPLSLPVFVAGLCCFLSTGRAEPPRVEFTGTFAPAEGWVRPPEQPFRGEICLNGAWQFQPVRLPAGFARDLGHPPELPAPRADGWEATSLKVPSPWNVNAWGCGRDTGEGTEHPYWPGSVYFPSYPAAWDHVEMGWLRRGFTVPAEWAGRRVALHFEAVAGECEVWVNGKRAGSHFDKYLPFDLDITGLVDRGGTNELRVGVRAHSLFNERSARYPKMRLPYPCGSETERLVGIWQDVFLVSQPAVRVGEVFVKPLVDQDALELEVAVVNDSGEEQTVSVGTQVSPWVNLAGTNVLSAPEPRWRLDPAILTVQPRSLTLKSGETKTVVLREAVGGRLKFWAPGSPQLYASIASVRIGNRVVDKCFTRFGWRQFEIHGRNLLLNGRRIQLYGDLLHPFGPSIMSRRFVWAWYRMIQDFGGNAVRPHAQVHPRHYLDLADEMGIVVLDESAIFGSSVALNFDSTVAWQRFADHVDGLVLRDRNHPSVVGWSVGNELFAIFNLNPVPQTTADQWYRQLGELAQRPRRLDPTRPWVSCDGDEDLRGATTVWSKHFGHGTPLDRLPNLEKPQMVGESGGSYYARPRQLAEFNGPAAFESYARRNDALGIDLYDNLVRMARPRLAYFSASETAWFGLEHLNFGYRDFSRLPAGRDGVFFTHPFTEGQPGMQPERLPPYVTTLNPGWDAGLPLYRPLGMFLAQKAALAGGGPEACPWDHRAAAIVRPPPPEPAPVPAHVAFIGEPGGLLGRRMAALGVPIAKEGPAVAPGALTIVDGDASTETTLAQAKAAVEKVGAEGGVALFMLGEGKARAEQLAGLLPAPVRLTERAATALVPETPHPWTA